jgi:hypothetical protein
VDPSTPFPLINDAAKQHHTSIICPTPGGKLLPKLLLDKFISVTGVLLVITTV